MNVKVKYRHIPPKKNESIECAFDFAKEIQKVASNGPKDVSGAIWLRGQSDSGWKVFPGIGRERYDFGVNNAISARSMLSMEKDFLHRFRRYAHSFMQREITLWEAITMAQHHGLPTRLLDWTSSALVALYFACRAHVSGKSKKNGAVYAIRLWRDRADLNVFDEGGKQSNHVRNPADVKGFKIIYSMTSTTRLVAQSGAFTIQDPAYSLESQSGKPFDKKHLDIYELREWTVPVEKKADILSQLERVGINPRTLFPDFDGIASGILHTEFFRERNLKKRKRP